MPKWNDRTSTYEKEELNRFDAVDVLSKAQREERFRAALLVELHAIVVALNSIERR